MYDFMNLSYENKLFINTTGNYFTRLLSLFNLSLAGSWLPFELGEDRNLVIHKGKSGSA